MTITPCFRDIFCKMPWYGQKYLFFFKHEVNIGVEESSSQNLQTNSSFHALSRSSAKIYTKIYIGIKPFISNNFLTSKNYFKNIVIHVVHVVVHVLFLQKRPVPYEEGTKMLIMCRCYNLENLQTYLS